MTHYKLAVFGDSYADQISPNMFSRGWFNYLCKNLGALPKTQYNCAESGTGIWWAYTNMLAFLEQGNTTNNMVFCATTPGRMPLPFTHSRFSEDYNQECPMISNDSFLYELASDNETSLKVVSEEWTLNEKHIPNSNYTMHDVFNMWYHVWDKPKTEFNDTGYNCGNLTNFIAKHVIEEVIDICKHKGINLTLIFPFGAENFFQLTQNGFAPNELSEFIQKNSDLMIIDNIDIVSRKEMSMIPENCENAGSFTDGVVELIWYKDKDKNIVSHTDSRCNHLMNENNQLLAEIIHCGISGQKTGLVHFDQEPGLCFDEELFKQYADKIREHQS